MEKKDSYSIFVCKNCKHGQVLPKLSLDAIKLLYTDSGHDSNIIKKQNQSLDEVLVKEFEYPNSTVDAKNIYTICEKYNTKEHYKKLLDIGAGYGFFTKEFLKNDFQVEAIEMASLERTIFFELNGFHPVSCSFEEFSTQDKFSHILMSQILEHVIDPDFWLQKANNILVDEGVLIIALPNFGSIFRLIMKAKEPYIIPPYHLNYFTKKSLILLLKKNNFEIIHYNTISRLPFKKILKKFPKWSIEPLSVLGNTILIIFDFFEFGSIHNIYAKKR